MVDIQCRRRMGVDLRLPVDAVGRDRWAFEFQIGEAAGVGTVEVQRRPVDKRGRNYILQEHVAVLHPEAQLRRLTFGDLADFQLALNKIRSVCLVRP